MVGEVEVVLDMVESLVQVATRVEAILQEARDGMFLKQRQHESGYTLITQS